MTAGNADEWVRNAPGTEGVLALAILKVIVDEGLAAGGASELAMLRGAAGGVDLAAAATASGVPAETIKRLAHEAAASKSGLALGGGVGVTGTNATETQIAINLLNVALGAYPKLVRFGGDSAFGKASPYAEMLSLTEAMGKGEVEVLILADVNPVFTHAPQVGLRRGPRQGSARGEPGQSAQRDGVARGPRLARAPSARVVGGFCRRGRRDRAHAADHGARPDRRQAGGRQVHRRYPAVRRPSGAGRGCRQGPAQVGELRGAGEGRVEEARQGLRGRAALHRLLAGLSRARGRVALRAGRGGGAQGRPAANRAGGRQARRGRIARAPRLPVRALLRRPRRRQAVAAGSAGRHDPDHVGRLGRGPLGDGHPARR